MFNKGYFKWKGKSSKDFFIMSISEDNEGIRELGIPYKINLSKDGNTWIENDDEPEQITLNLMLTDGMVPLKWNTENIKKVTDWLLSDEFEEFISYDDMDTVYYFKVIEIVRKFTANNFGWLQVTFQSLKNEAYTKKIIKEKITGHKILKINNPTNKVYEPFIIINNFGTKEGYIRINDMIIDDVDEGETIFIDNYMTNIQNHKGENKLMYSNRAWIRLTPGDNQIFIEGNCEVEIICNFPKIG